MSCSDSSKTTEAECVAPAVWTPAAGGRRGMKVKTLRRMLKKKGMKTTGKKATLMKRLHMRGGGDELGSPIKATEGGRRRRRREEEGGSRRKRREEEEGGRRRHTRRGFMGML